MTICVQCFGGREEVEGFLKIEVLSTSEVAEILGVNKQRMSKLISDKCIEAVKKDREYKFVFTAGCGGVERKA